jgi:transposase
MGKRRKFTNEFRLEAVKLAESGQASVAQAARELGLHENVLRKWIKLYGKQPEGGRVTPDEREELLRLRRENRRLTMERDILKKAAKFFAQECE